jgi:hypothetical protein
MICRYALGFFGYLEALEPRVLIVSKPPSTIEPMSRQIVVTKRKYIDTRQQPL